MLMMRRVCLVLFCVATIVRSETIITIQPHSDTMGYVVTYSWKGTFGGGMGASVNANNAYIDDNTKAFSSDYVMPLGNHAGAKIRYSQHNNDGINTNHFQVPAFGANPVHYDGTSGESLVPGEWMMESSHADIGLTNSVNGDWYNNPDDYGGVRFFGTGIQGAQSLTNWNGIGAASAYGNVAFEGAPLLGQGMQFGVNGSSPGVADSLRAGMVGDAEYWNRLNRSNDNNGLLIGYFPYATNFPGGVPADKFTNQFHVGSYTNASNDTTLHIINDSAHVPVLVSEATAFEIWSGGEAFTADTNDDGVPNGAAWLFGAESPTNDVASLVPVYDNHDPDFFIMTYYRSEAAISGGATDVPQYTSDLLAEWGSATSGDDIVITTTEDGGGVGVDMVAVKFGRTLFSDGRGFVRLLILAPEM